MKLVFIIVVLVRWGGCIHSCVVVVATSFHRLAVVLAEATTQDHATPHLTL